MKVAPSILAADFAHLADDVARVAPASDLLHVDCMDGHYVPNLSIGPPVVKSLRPHTDLFLDCHLMVDNPAVLLGGFADAGADGITVHIELGDPRALLAEIRELGMRTGLSFEPDTPFDAVEPFLGEIDLLLGDERADRFRRAAVHRRGARQGARRSQAHRRSRPGVRDRDRRRHQDRQCRARG